VAQKNQSKDQRPSLPTIRIAAWSVGIASVAVAMFLVYTRVDHFLIRDPRFALSIEDRALEIQGVSHASRRAIETVFDDDYGASVYLIPLSERRGTLLHTVDWVKDASLSRRWPNRVVVRVEERTPVAFVTLNSGSSSSKFALIDEDGVILPPAPDRFGLPVLSGVRAKDPPDMRRDRVHRMQRLLRELGEQGRNLSEIDVSEPDDIKVLEPRDGRILKLLLGDRNYALRYRNFVSHYKEIVERLPGAVTLDLRLEDRITVVE
jgi:cell division protein FtsQ